MEKRPIWDRLLAADFPLHVMVPVWIAFLAFWYAVIGLLA